MKVNNGRGDCEIPSNVLSSVLFKMKKKLFAKKANRAKNRHLAKTHETGMFNGLVCLLWQGSVGDLTLFLNLVLFGKCVGSFEVKGKFKPRDKLVILESGPPETNICAPSVEISDSAAVNVLRLRLS